LLDPVCGSASFLANHQLGGQAANVIYNVGPQVPSISDAHRQALAAALRSLPSEQFLIVTGSGDPQAIRFGSNIQEVLQCAGWVYNGQKTVTPSPPPGVTLHVPAQKNSTDVLAKWLRDLDILRGYESFGHQQVIEIRVGPV